MTSKYDASGRRIEDEIVIHEPNPHKPNPIHDCHAVNKRHAFGAWRPSYTSYFQREADCLTCDAVMYRSVDPT